MTNSIQIRMFLMIALAGCAIFEVSAQPATIPTYEYKLLATSKTSTMEKELNATAATGYRFAGMMGGETAFGGNETVAAMVKMPADGAARYEYKLLATQRTSTMQKELQRAAESGFEYRGQSVFETAFGGREVVVILERDASQRTQKHDYHLLATSRTSTMQKELNEAGSEGFEIMGITVAETSFGGKELVVIVRRPK